MTEKEIHESILTKIENEVVETIDPKLSGNIKIKLLEEERDIQDTENIEKIKEALFGTLKLGLTVPKGWL